MKYVCLVIPKPYVREVEAPTPELAKDRAYRSYLLEAMHDGVLRQVEDVVCFPEYEKIAIHE